MIHEFAIRPFGLDRILAVQWDKSAGAAVIADARLQGLLDAHMRGNGNGFIGEGTAVFSCADPRHDAQDFMALLMAIAGDIIESPLELGSLPLPLPPSEDEIQARALGLAVLN